MPSNWTTRSTIFTMAAVHYHEFLKFAIMVTCILSLNFALIGHVAEI